MKASSLMVYEFIGLYFLWVCWRNCWPITMGLLLPFHIQEKRPKKKSTCMKGTYVWKFLLLERIKCKTKQISSSTWSINLFSFPSASSSFFVYCTIHTYYRMSVRTSTYRMKEVVQYVFYAQHFPSTSQTLQLYRRRLFISPSYSLRATMAKC